MIISMVYYLMNPSVFSVGSLAQFTGTTNGCVIILDLHWNYSMVPKKLLFISTPLINVPWLYQIQLLLEFNVIHLV